MKSTPTPRWNSISRSRALVAGCAALAAVATLGGCAGPIEGLEKDIKPADLEALKTEGTKANGLVAWTSSRAGLPHIFSMKTDGSEMKQLTRGDHTDWYPRFSPDGRKILFSRSHDKGFVRESEANTPETWDLYTIDATGGALAKVVANATWGSWAGPDEILFMRGSRIMRTKLGVEGEAKVVDTARYPLLAGATVQAPELSHDGHFVALTLAGAHRQAGIWSIKKKTWTQMGQGGRIAWAPDGASVYWFDVAGKEQSRIAHEPVVAGTPADERDPDKLLLVDLPGRRSRERFPRLSNDGKWLVFAASIGGLENDLEDYELFLWEAGAPATTATRLTFHSANDRWPDLFVGEPGTAAAPGADESKVGAEGGEEGEAAPAAKAEGVKAPPEEEAKEPAAAPAAAPEETDESTPAPAPKPPKKKKRR